MPAEYRIAQLTDLHLQPDPSRPYRGVDLIARLEVVLEDIARQGPPDLLLLTGDLTHHGTAQTYHWLAQRTANVAPQVAWLPGNHDIADYMRGALWPAVLELEHWQILLLDSTANPDGMGSGALAEAQLQHLAQQLDRCSKPALVALHHNPLATGSGWQDPIMLSNAARFWQQLEGFTQLKAVVHGHIHQAFDQSRGTVRVLGTPAIAPQFKAGQAQFQLEDQPHLARPGWRQLRLGEAGHFSTQLHYC